MSSEEENLQERLDKVDEAFRYYRERGSIFTYTIIVFSSVVLGWVLAKDNLYIPVREGWRVIFFIFGILSLVISIVAGIFFQFFIFEGYNKHAQSKLALFHALREELKNKSMGKTENENSVLTLINTAWKCFEDSNDKFTPAKKYAHTSFISFFIGFITIFIFISIQFFNSTG